MSTVTQIVFYLHSGVRWLVIIAALVALVYMIYGLISGRAYDRNAGLLMTIFTRLIELQWLLGVLLIIAWAVTFGGVISYQWEHLAWMTVAVVVAHLYMGFRRRPDRMKYLGGLIAIIATVIVVYIGISRLPGNRWGAPQAPNAPASTLIVTAPDWM